jgi:Ca-activated chloride channel family protein
MRFAEPHWILIGAVVSLLLFALRARSERLTTRALAQLSGARLLTPGGVPSPRRRWFRTILMCAAVLSGFVALARPQKGLSWQRLERKGTDLLFVIDTSKSMDADDVQPTRLERTKLAVQDLVARFPEDRIGLLAFAGDAYVESPLTLDHDALLETLNAFDSHTIPRPGTDVGLAIDKAVGTLKADAGQQKLMVLVTDGEDLKSGAVAAAKRAGAAGVTIHTIGVGTRAGEIVPAKNELGQTIGVVRDAAGEPVRSRLDESSLREIAQAAHGTYRPLGSDGTGLDGLYTEALAPHARVEQGAKLRRVYAEWFAVPLALALFGLVLDALLGVRIRNSARSRSPASRAAVASAAGMIAALSLLPNSANASVQSAQQAYYAGRYEASAAQYAAESARDPKDARLAVDAGAAAYRAKRYDVAEAALSKALTVADPKLQQRVLYDLGNARYRQGQTKLDTAREIASERWKAAILAYDGALKLDPKDADARFNRDLVQRKLNELERERERQRDQQDSQHQPSQGGDPKPSGENTQSPNQQGQGKQNQAQPSQGQGQQKQSEPSRGQPSQNQQSEPEQSRDQRGQTEQGQRSQAKEARSSDAPGAAAGERARDADRGDAPSKLSPSEARALLDSVRGEERRVSFGKTKETPDADAPEKDW